MNIYQLEKRNRDKQNDPGQQKTKDPLSLTLKRQLSWAAGTDAFAERDPSYHLSEEFTGRMDYAGMLYARAMGQEEASDLSDNAGHREALRERREADSQEYSGHPSADREITDMGENYVARDGNGDMNGRPGSCAGKKRCLSTAFILFWFRKGRRRRFSSEK